MAEWISTNDARYWMHVPCGGTQDYRYLGRHNCEPQKEEPMAYNNGKCLDCGASVSYGMQTQHSAFHNNFIHRSQVKDGFAVSAVKWCDAGNHPFKAGEPGAQSIDVTQRDDEGAETRVVMDMCAQHAFPTGTQSVSKLREVEAAYRAEKATYVPTDE